MRLIDCAVVLCSLALLIIYSLAISDAHSHPRRDHATGFFYFDHTPPSLVISSRTVEYSVPILSVNWPHGDENTVMKPDALFQWPTVPIDSAAFEIVFDSNVYPSVVEIVGYTSDPSLVELHGQVLHECYISRANDNLEQRCMVIVNDNNRLNLIFPGQLLSTEEYQFFVINTFYAGIVSNGDADFGFVSYGYEAEQ